MFQDETPLFLSVKEGNYEVCEILLGHFANRMIADHMDRLPCDVALEMRYFDILQLLNDYYLSSNNLCMTTASETSLSNIHYALPAKQSKLNKRRRHRNPASGPNSSHSVYAAVKPNCGSMQKKSRKSHAECAMSFPNTEIPVSDAIISGLKMEQRSPPQYEQAVVAHYENPGHVMVRQKQAVNCLQLNGGFSVSDAHSGTPLLDWSALLPSVSAHNITNLHLMASSCINGSVSSTTTMSYALPFSSPAHLQSPRCSAATAKQFAAAASVSAASEAAGAECCSAERSLRHHQQRLRPDYGVPT